MTREVTPFLPLYPLFWTFGQAGLDCIFSVAPLPIIHLVPTHTHTHNPSNTDRSLPHHCSIAQPCPLQPQRHPHPTRGDPTASSNTSQRSSASRTTIQTSPDSWPLSWVCANHPRHHPYAPNRSTRLLQSSRIARVLQHLS